MEDHNVFHVYGGESSSENSYGDDEESLQVDEGLIIDQDTDFLTMQGGIRSGR